MADEALSLEAVLGDLRRILEVVVDKERGGSDASYEEVQQALSGDLHLHILSYVRFLETQGYLVYDRIHDQMSVEAAGLQALDSPQTWRDKARQAFADHIDESAAGPGDLDDLLDGVDEDLLDEIAGASIEADDDALVAAAGIGAAGEPAARSARDDIADALDEVSAELDDEELATQVADIDQVPPLAGSASAESSSAAPSSAGASAFKAKPATKKNTSITPTSNTSDPSMARDAMNRDVTRGHFSTTSTAGAADAYERHDEIGAGGVGTVWRATQSKLARDVAVKEINQVFNVFAGVKREDIVNRFIEIVQTQAKLVHPNVVQIIDVETNAEFPYVVTQYAPNGNLRRLIDVDERPPLSVALKYFLQILAGLHAAHSAGVVHGNIKPENVVLDAAGNAMLADFGMGNVVEREGGQGQVYVGVGTVAYMSPEQFQNPNTATAKSDIYSLGIMFYEMLTGKVPGRRSPMPSSFFPDIPRKLDDIFDRMSMDDVEDRYESIQEVLEDIYGAQEVLDLLDRRSGILFVSDPLSGGGGFGGVAVTEGASEEGLGEESSSDAGLGEESSSDLEEESSEAEEDSEADEISEADDIDADELDDAELDDVEAGEVLGKLDKYSEMFDEDDEESEEESDEEDED